MQSLQAAYIDSLSDLETDAIKYQMARIRRILYERESRYSAGLEHLRWCLNQATVELNKRGVR